MAVQFHQVRCFDLAAAGQPVFFRLRQRAQQKVTRRGKTQNCQAPLGRAAAVLGQVGVEIFLAQHAINRFGHRGALARAQAQLAKAARHHHVGGLVKFENLLE